MTEMNLEPKVSFSDFICTCVTWDCVTYTNLAPVFPVICENFSRIKKCTPLSFVLTANLRVVI